MNAILNSKDTYLKHFILECEAQDGDAMRFTIIEDDKDSLYITTTSDLFSEKQNSILDRIKLAFKILLGKEFWYHSIIVTKEDLQKLKEFLNNNY
ncbi:MAG: hypothetical protein MJ224_01305 [archaeon]|nr:hypothetical protein [archaeon]